MDTKGAEKGAMELRPGNDRSEDVIKDAQDQPPQGNTEDVNYRYDAVLWLFGMLFFILLQCAMFGIGATRGWDANSPYDHNSSSSSQQRFLPEPFIPEPGVYKRSDPEASSRWYYWKLKPEMVRLETKLFVWICYAAHNLSVWLVLYLQQKSKHFTELQKKKYGISPDKYNLIQLGLNAGFHVIHLINTHTTYDGTAPDVSEGSSQSSVIVALIIILFIEFQERGIFFGYPTRQQLRHSLRSVFMSPVYLIRKFHGYFIYWAAIYTFWYHPMENTWAHAFGFTHTWMFMLQGSLAYQRAHLNKYWRLSLEVWVAMHAGVTAYQTVPSIMGKELWPMFVFGFVAVFILTQLYGLPFWTRLPPWTRVVPAFVYISVTIATFNFIKDQNGQRFVRMAEVIRIPGIYYLLFLVGWMVITLIAKTLRLMNGKEEKNKLGVSEKSNSNTVPAPSIFKEVIVIFFFLLTYLLSIFISWLFEFLDIKLNLIVFTMLYSFSFLLIPAITGSFILNTILPTSLIAAKSDY